MVGLGASELMLILLLGGGGFGLPLSVPPLPPDPVVQRAAPDDTLLYFSWAGVAKADPASKNKTEALMAEPEVQAFVAQLEAAIKTALAREAGDNPDHQVVATVLPKLIKTLLVRPMALYVTKVAPQPGGVDVRGGLIVNLGSGAAATRADLESLLRLAVPPGAPGGAAAAKTVAGVAFKVLPTPPGAPSVMWGSKGEYLLVAVGQGSAETLVARLDPKIKVASWLEQLRAHLPVSRPSTTSFLDVGRVVALMTQNVPEPRIAALLGALGVSNVKSISSVSGLSETGMLSRTLVAIEGEPAGIFAVAAGKPLTAADLRPIPRDANLALAMRLDLGQVYDRVLEGVGKVEPQARDFAAQGISQVEQQLGFSIADDLLKALGDTWCLYNSPEQGGVLLTGTALVVSVRDRTKLQTAHDALVQMASTAMQGQGRPEATIKEFTFRGTKAHYVQFVGQPVPFAPAWCLTDNALVVALYPQMIKAYLARGANAGSLADVPQVAAMLKGTPGPTMLTYQDTPALVRTAYPLLQMMAASASAMLAQQGIPIELPALPSLASIAPHADPSLSMVRRIRAGLLLDRVQTLPTSGTELSSSGPILAAVLLPAVQAARAAATRNSAMNRLHNIGIAMHNHAGAQGESLPAPAIYDKNGKPLLSWRVQLLPYIEGEKLYKQFHLDEPWDSPHNSKLIAQMPSTYADPDGGALAAEGKTRFVLPTGESTLFDGAKGKKFTAVTDGLSRTIMAVEVSADKAVVWTKPEDLKIDWNDLTVGLRGARSGRFFLALMGDASVQLIDDAIDQQLLKGLFTPAGGEAVEIPCP